MTPADDDGPAPPAGITRIVIDSEPLAVRAALVQLFDSLLLRSLPPDQRDSAEIVLAEVLNNVVEHAYATRQGQIELSLEFSGGGLTCQVSDRGDPMPDGRLPPGRDTEAARDEAPEGGFGWSLIRTLARDLEYLREDGLNRLRFRLDGDAFARACPEGGSE